MRTRTGAVALLCAASIWAGAGAGSPNEHKMHEGAISITGEGTVETMKVLGGFLGNETVHGLDVGLFVLQAESPARLAPGAKGPTHLFNLTFTRAGAGGSAEGLTGAIVIEGADGTQRAAFRPFASHYQATARLEREGDYRIRVEFVAGEREARTAAYPFSYRRREPAEHRH